MFNQLGDQLEGVFKTLRGQGKISEKNIADAMQQIRVALLEADVAYSVVKTLIANIKEQALGEKVLKSIKPGEQIVKIFSDELVALLSVNKKEISLAPPAHMLICGLNGAGKTTTAAKLAHHYKKQGKKPLLVACDLYRPAAVDQLATLAKQIDVPCFCPPAGMTDVKEAVKLALQWSKEQASSLVIFDTAGRQEIDGGLIMELQNVHALINPQETLLVVDGATGQQAVSVAESFDKAVKVSGLILTKLDGDARGGAALSVSAVTNKPIQFIGEGEKVADLQAFDAKRLVDRILGMGDMVSLVEKAAESISEEQAAKAAKRMESGQFDFNDFLEQLKMMQNMGPLEGLMGLIPGMNKMKDQLPAAGMSDKKIKQMEAIVLSMTKQERSQPEILKPSRRERIAKGSGTSLMQVNQLLKQFNQMKQMFGSQSKMKQMMGAMGGMGGGMPDLANMDPAQLQSLMGGMGKKGKKRAPGRRF